MISVGGRPSYDIQTIFKRFTKLPVNCKNIKKYALSSDDIFYYGKDPKDTLIIGGGYIALELAGIIGQLGTGKVDVIARNEFLSCFD